MTPSVNTSKHEAICCPRCGADFVCKPGSVPICHCFEFNLTVERQEWISERWQGCLCGRCLREIVDRPIDEH